MRPSKALEALTPLPSPCDFNTGTMIFSIFLDRPKV